MKTRIALVTAVLTLVFVGKSIHSKAQTNYTLKLAIDGYENGARVFKSTDYEWVFVLGENRYFFRSQSSPSFVELNDPELLQFADIGFNGFNANPYNGKKYGSEIIPTSNGFICAQNLMGSPNKANLISVDFNVNKITLIESGAFPLLGIGNLIEYDNNIYFRARSTDIFTAIYKLKDNSWELTYGGDFFKDYEVGSQFIFDEEGNRLILSTGIIGIKQGVWSFNGNVYTELDNTNNENEFLLTKFIGFTYKSSQDKGTPVMLGYYKKNDNLGQELYSLDGNEINLITNASLDYSWSNIYNTVFNDHFDLILAGYINDSITPTNQYTSKQGQGVYKLNTNLQKLERLVHPTDNIHTVSYAVRNKEGIYFAAKNSNSNDKYYIYLYRNDNPILEKIDLNGEFLDSKSGLFVSDDVVYFVTNKGFCKIINSQFLNFYESFDYWGEKKDEILFIENDKIYINSYYDNSFRILSPESTATSNSDKPAVITVFPNPAKDLITVQLKTPLIDSNYLLYDISGRVILNGTLDSEISNISISNLSYGIYILNIVGKNNQSFKVVKK